ncbi:MAG: class I SAM-dependent methyltransferase [Candidatus Solibacter sp.]
MSVCLMCGATQATARFHGSDRLYHTTTRQFTVVACDQCGLLRLDPAPTPEELERYYPDNYWFAPDRSTASRMEETYRRLVLRDHVQFVSQALAASSARGPLLDVGCGGGLFLGMMRERGAAVVGLDYSPQAAGIAWRRQLVPALAADLLHSPLRPASFAGLTMFHVMEHLYDPRAYLGAARELLMADGRLVVQVPNADSWQARLLGSAWNGADIPRHLTNFRAADLEKLLHGAGFEVLRRKFFSLRDNPAGLASSVAPGLDPMARRVRRVSESGVTRLLKDLTYFGLVAASLPFAAAEAAAGAGSSVMLEARPR